MAVVGAGQFGKNHCRVVSESPDAELVAVVDRDAGRAAEAVAAWGGRALEDIAGLDAGVDAAIVAAPTSAHAEIGCALLGRGIHVLVEKPMAACVEGAARLVEAAQAAGRVLQVGHLERFNPAVAALEARCRLPLFFEVHRLSVFSPRSLDIDVVLDLMIHDLDIVLSLTGAMPVEIRAAGISILSEKVDIANVRLEFANGCTANLTASRVSTERVRKLRVFQPRRYFSLDYGRQTLAAVTVGAERRVGFEQIAVPQGEPLALQFASFLQAIRGGGEVKVSGESARRSLEAALAIADKIKEHASVVAHSLAAAWTP